MIELMHGLMYSGTGGTSHGFVKDDVEVKDRIEGGTAALSQARKIVRTAPVSQGNGHNDITYRC
ncbi:MAG: hypothetical protein ACRDQ5_02600 [Sciscionella sp.]